MPIEDLIADLTYPGAFPLVVTGAGISVASGIPTFRGDDPDAIWSRDVMEMGTAQFFYRKPAEQWRWYLDRFSKCRDAKPNVAHYALADLEKKILENQGNFQIVTQNVDGLHIVAGSQSVIEIHGAARKVRCSSSFCENGIGYLNWDDDLFAPFIAKPGYSTLPKCELCDSILRPHVLWFDEGYMDHSDYRMNDVENLIDKITSIIFIGTSFSVGITYFLTIDVGLKKGLPMYVIDPHLNTAPHPKIELIKDRSEVVLPEILTLL